jgi:putative hemolysin
MTILYFLFLSLMISSAFFSSSETAFFSLSKHQRHRLAQSPRSAARRVAHLRDNPRSLLVTVLFGNELTNIALSIVSASILNIKFPQLSIAEQALMSASIVVPTLLIFGEITFKSLAALMSERVSILFVYPLSAFSWLITPARWALLKAANSMMRLFGEGKEEGEVGLNEESFKALVDAGTREGVLDQDESELIHNAFQFNDRFVGEVMIQWNQAFILEESTSINDALVEVSNRAYSRIPLWSTSNQMVTGVLYAKDLLVHRWSTPSDPEVLNEMVKTIAHRPVFTTPQTSLVQLLDIFKRTRKHLAVVINHTSGDVLGLCTLEDVLEVIFGPIHEESMSEDMIAPLTVDQLSTGR